MFSLSKENVKSALVYTVLTAVVSMGMYVVGVGDVFKVDAHTLINSGVMAFIIGIVSLLKNLLTDKAGNFLGMVKVVDTAPVLTDVTTSEK